MLDRLLFAPLFDLLFRTDSACTNDFRDFPTDSLPLSGVCLSSRPPSAAFKDASSTVLLC